MIKGTFSRTEGRYIDFGMEQGTVSFPPTGSGWFGLYMLTGGACVLRFAAADGTAFNYQLEHQTRIIRTSSSKVTRSDFLLCSLIRISTRRNNGQRNTAGNVFHSRRFCFSD